MFGARSSKGRLVARVLGLGAVAGIRSVSAPAQLSRAASHGKTDGIEKTLFAPLASTRAARLLTVLAVGEVIADEYSGAPDRVSLPVSSEGLPRAPSSGQPCSPPRVARVRRVPRSALSPPWRSLTPRTICGSG